MHRSEKGKMNELRNPKKDGHKTGLSQILSRRLNLKSLWKALGFLWSPARRGHGRERKWKILERWGLSGLHQEKKKGEK